MLCCVGRSILPLPETTPSAARVTLHRFSSGDISDYDANSIYKLMMMIGDIRLAEEVLISGDIFIYDVKNMSLGHVAHHTTPSLKKALNIAQEAYPQRLKEIHIINAPPFITRVINFARQLMKEKMRNRVSEVTWIFIDRGASNKVLILVFFRSFTCIPTWSRCTNMYQEIFFLWNTVVAGKL